MGIHESRRQRLCVYLLPRYRGGRDLFQVRSEPAKPNLSESGFLYNAKLNIRPTRHMIYRTYATPALCRANTMPSYVRGISQVWPSVSKRTIVFSRDSNQDIERNRAATL